MESVASCSPTHSTCPPRWLQGPQPLLREEDREEDEDVGRERDRVRQGATQGDVLVLKDVTKVRPLLGGPQEPQGKCLFTCLWIHMGPRICLFLLLSFARYTQARRSQQWTTCVWGFPQGR